MEPAARTQHRISGALVAPAVRAGIVARPALWEQLGNANRVTVVSAPPGSGKTLLLRSWTAELGLADRAAWVAAQDQERDPQRFWVGVADALRGTAAGSALVRPLTASPDLDGWAVVEQLLADLGALADRVWLVIDDVHELASTEALRQLELLVMRAPPELRLVLVSRQDVRLGLHRLRLEGELTEIRAGDLRFTMAEARALFEAAGVSLADEAVASLHERTEGWAAGLRLAALSLSGHPDPERFAAEFCGSERTVAEYLLAEVLERQSEEVRRLLLRTSVLERLNGPLADLLTGDSGGERMLQELEQANAFVVSLDVSRSWFRYHQMFAELLQLELRRAAPGELPALHRAAAEWFAGHGYPVEAVRHAQAALAWDLAARLLADHYFRLSHGQAATVHELLTAFPAGIVAADAELTALTASDELRLGLQEEAERHLAQAERGLEATGGPLPVPAERRGRLQTLLALGRLRLARQRSDLRAVVEEVNRLSALAEATDAAQLGLGEDLQAQAVISLGIAEVWAGRLADADLHLEQGVALARRIGQPYLELTGLAHGAVAAYFGSYVLAEQRSRQAVELARRHGWGQDQATAVAYTALGSVMVGQGRLAEAEPWLERAAQTLRTEAEPAAGMGLHHARCLLELIHGSHADALAEIQAAERLAERLVTPHTGAMRMRARMLQTLVRVGQTVRVEAALAGLAEHEQASVEMRTTLASLRLAQGDPRAAATALAPILGDSAPGFHTAWTVTALLLEAIARDQLGDAAAARRALERALDIAGRARVLIPFLLDPAPGLLERHARHRTPHAALISEILGLLDKTGSPGADNSAAPPVEPLIMREPLSEAETRVLRYLPTNLSAPEIAGELSLSVNTIRTHMRHLYDKLSAHRRSEAVEQARALGLLAPSRPRR
jgi:LuxR family maltose regulon positive regulatory protein